MLLRTLLLILCTASYGAMAQGPIDIKSTILDEVDALKVTKKPDEYNLKGKVKSMVEINTTQKDTLLHLTFNSLGKSTLVQEPDYQMTYSYAGDQLLSTTRIRKSYPYDTVIGSYNSSGQLIKAVARYKSQDETNGSTIRYSYTNKGKRITAHYSYSFDTSRWDVVHKDVYDVTFDKKGRLITVKNKSVHKEYTYGATRSLSYDSLDRIVHVSFIDKDAGSNSAPMLYLSIYHDDKEHSMTETLTDQTVRNSLWSYGYTKYERYNDNGDVIATEYRRHDEEQYGSLELAIDKKEAITEFKPTFEYDYDAHGNWITKYMVDNQEKFEVAKREIAYYD